MDFRDTDHETRRQMLWAMVVVNRIGKEMTRDTMMYAEAAVEEFDKRFKQTNKTNDAT